MKTIDNFLQELDVPRAVYRTYKRKDQIKKAIKAADKLINDKNIDVQEATISRAIFALSKRKTKVQKIIEKINSMLRSNPEPNQAVQLHNALRRAQEKVADLNHKIKLASALSA